MQQSNAVYQDNKEKSAGVAKILAIDDEPHFLALLTKTLVKEGYDIKTALNGEDALKRLEQESFNLVLIDVSMPRLNGLFLLDYIKKTYSPTKIIVITGHPDMYHRAFSFEHGAAAYLTKPLDIEEIKKTIRETLSH
ncbi:MAG: response regulator [Deltaproteobacteria bacterium]|nr:response regulator [Deltaproteobacteria bacterium]